MLNNHKNIYFTLIKYLIFLFFLMCNNILFAQNKPEMADVMRSNGKIYVVVAVCLTILIGLFAYVFVLDKKIKRLEDS